MNKIFLNLSIGIIASLSSYHLFAGDTIQVTVTAIDKAAAVGFLVDGRRIGGLGKTYSGHGPINKKYSFGYRTSAFSGVDIPCGSTVLNKNSKVKLIIKEGQCHSLVNAL